MNLANNQMNLNEQELRGFIFFKYKGIHNVIDDILTFNTRAWWLILSTRQGPLSFHFKLSFNIIFCPMAHGDAFSRYKLLEISLRKKKVTNKQKCCTQPKLLEQNVCWKMNN